MGSVYLEREKHRLAGRLLRWQCVAALALFAQVAFAAEWPQWRGPNRDGKSVESGLLKQWPEGGPRLLWAANGIGHGFSTVVIADGTIYTTGIVGTELVLTALTMDGEVQWQKPIGPGWHNRRQHPGARSTPTIDGERLYVISGHGKLYALDRSDGREVWSVDMISEFQGKLPQWGCSESVLIDGDLLLCTPGGDQVGMVALNKTTGETVWRGDPLNTPAAYASPILVEFAGTRQIIHLVQSGLVGVQADTGKLLWRYQRAAPPNRPACSPPLYSDGRAFGASGYNNGGGLVQLATEGNQVTATELWDTKDMVNQHGGMVLVDGHIYGNHRNGWSCLDLATGATKWHASGVGKGSITYADGMLYCFSEKTGTAGLVKATPTAFEMVSSFTPPGDGPGPYWTHPVVCGGRLYLRRSGTLFAYDVKAPQ